MLWRPHPKPCLTNPAKRNIIPSIRGSRRPVADIKSEPRPNALARAVCFHRLGRLRDRTLESQQHRAGGLNLVVAAIVLWNTAYMERAIRHLRARGEKIPNELMPYLAPLGWQHINLTGDYIWTEPSRLDGEGFRPLTARPHSPENRCFFRNCSI